MPDLNSLPPSSPTPSSRTMTSPNNGEPAAPRGDSPSPSPRASVSLQAAATMNAGLQHEPTRRPGSSSSSLARNRHSPQSGRRRSQVLMNLQLNDPGVPAPGEMLNEPQPSGFGTTSPQPLSQSPRQSPLLSGRDSYHGRSPSIGELHQELENESEAQVNRLLGMIRQQQLQLQQLQTMHSQAQSTESAVVDSSDRPGHPSGSAPPSAHPVVNSIPRSPVHPHPRSSFDMARADLQQRRSRTPSRTASPRLRSTSISGESGEQWVLGGRDESAFYQAETQMLVRENQMLRLRVRELEKQLTEMSPSNPASVTHEPTQHSHLTQSTSVSEEEEAGAGRARPEPLPTVVDAPREE